MRLLTPPWKTAWYDDHLADVFFQEMARSEKNGISHLETSAQWMEQLIIEFGQLAQNMIQLEHAAPAAAQIKQAMEKSLKLSVLAARLTASLDRTDPNRGHTPLPARPELRPPSAAVAAPAPNLAAAPPIPAARQAAGTPATGSFPGSPPMRETILSLSQRGLSVAEIEVITGQHSATIEKALARV